MDTSTSTTTCGCRRTAPSTRSTQTWLRISEKTSQGSGGGCYGDSGGPNFLAGTDIEAATTLTGDALCKSTNTADRLDTASARDFLGQYVALP